MLTNTSESEALAHSCRTLKNGRWPEGTGGVTSRALWVDPSQSAGAQGCSEGADATSLHFLKITRLRTW